MKKFFKWFPSNGGIRGGLYVAFGAELMKLKRSGIFWVTIVIFIVVPLMMGLMMFVARNPEIAVKLGMIGTKANLFGKNDWAGYLGLLSQIIASIGLIGFGFVTSWVFGREYTDRTLKDILALPIPRSSIVISKFMVIILWCSILSVIFYTVGILIGLFVGIPEWSFQLLSGFSIKFLAVALLTIMLCPPVAFFAAYSRGIIAPLGFVIFTLILAQFLGLIGLGPYFPWAIPGLHTIAEGTEGMKIVPASYIILVVTSGVGIWRTTTWWKHADQF